MGWTVIEGWTEGVSGAAVGWAGRSSLLWVWSDMARDGEEEVEEVEVEELEEETVVVVVEKEVVGVGRQLRRSDK